MLRFVFLFLVATIASGANAGDYEDAVLKAMREKKPLVVVVSAEWCGACGELKRDVIDPMRAEELKHAVVVTIDVDKEPDIASKIKRGETLPQVAIFKFQETWKRVSTVGKASRERIRQMLKKLKD